MSRRTSWLLLPVLLASLILTEGCMFRRITNTLLAATSIDTGRPQTAPEGEADPVYRRLFLSDSVLSVIVTGTKAQALKAYSGPHLPQDKVATLAVSPTTAITSVDGHEAPYDTATKVCWNGKIEVPPGAHNLEVAYRSSEYLGNNRWLIIWSVGTLSLSVDAKPGRVYLLKSSHSGPIGTGPFFYGTWKAWVEDAPTTPQAK